MTWTRTLRHYGPLLAASLAAVSPLQGLATPDKPTVLVFDLATEGIDDPSLGASVAGQIAEVIFARGPQVGTTHDVNQRVAVETQKELLGCQSNTACIAQITDAAGVDLVEAGRVSISVGP